MGKSLTLFVMSLAGVVALLARGGELKSGPEVGEYVSPFEVKDCTTGPTEGLILCYRCRYGARPVVSIFTRELNDQVAELIEAVDKTVAEHQDEQMAAFVVLLTDDQAAGEKTLKAAAEKYGIRTPLTLYHDAQGPSDYHIASDAEVTVAMWSGGQAKATRAFAKGRLDEAGIAAVIQDTEEILQ